MVAHTENYYRSLKKKLNKYHKFSFDLPPKGKKLSPAQKAAITRVANKIENYIGRVVNEKASFISKPKGYSLKEIPQALHTNKGIFYPSPGARLEYKKIKNKKKKSLHFVVRFRQLVEKFFPFPKYVLGDMEQIENYVNKLEKKYNPIYIMWAVNGFQGKVRYSPEAFGRYAQTLNIDSKFSDAFENAKRDDKNFFTGVYLGFRE